MTVVIVGAGLAGAAAARTLRAAGRSVVLADKGRGIGGRLATRRVSTTGGDSAARSFRFDHGAPAVAAGRSDDFGAVIGEAVAAGAAARWDGPASPGDIVGTPAMRDLAGFLLGGQTCISGAAVTALSRQGQGWSVALAEREPLSADAVIVTAPAPQSAALVGGHVRAFGDAAASARYAPCWTAMLAFADEVSPALADLKAHALAADGIETIIHNGGKPGRGNAATLVMHASAALATERLEEAREAMAAWFTSLARTKLGLPEPHYVAVHRWRYCRVVEPAAPQTVYDPALSLGIAGDWTAGPDAADAYDSGVRAAQALLAAR